MTVYLKFTAEELQELTNEVSIELMSQLIQAKTKDKYVIIPKAMIKEIYLQLFDCDTHRRWVEYERLVLSQNIVVLTKWEDELKRIKIVRSRDDTQYSY